MYKENAVGNVVAETGTETGNDLWDYRTTERSFNAVSSLCVAVDLKARLEATWTVCKIGGS